MGKTPPENKADWKNIVCKRIRLVRVAAGVRQNELAVRSNRAGSATISQLENGKLNSLPFTVAQQVLDLADKAGISRAWALGLSDDRAPAALKAGALSDAFMQGVGAGRFLTENVEKMIEAAVRKVLAEREGGR